MDNLGYYDNNSRGLHFIIDNKTGEVFTPVDTVVDLTGNDDLDLSSYVTGWVELGTPAGLETVDFLNEDRLVEVLYEYNTEFLKTYCLEGLRAYIHDLVGFRLKTIHVIGLCVE